MKILKLSILLLLLIFTINHAQQTSNKLTLNIGDNFRIYPSNVSQTEVFIVTHPSNPDIMFSSANTIVFNPFFVSEGVYVTTNGGTSWYGSDTCNGAPILFHGGDPGITIDKDGTFLLVRRSIFLSGGLFSHFSTDNGITWSNQNDIIINVDLERGNLTSDVHPASQYFGRSYVVWTDRTILSKLYFSYTNDGGVNWSAPAQINNPIQRSAIGDITMGSAGKVFVCWAGVTSISPFTEDYVGIASSTNGGSSWQVTENAFDMNGINGLLPEKGNIRVNGLPNIAIDTTGGPRDGWIYIITTQINLAPAGTDPDIILNRSTDGGSTWASGIRVNQDPLNDGKIQYFPAVHVDKTGGLNVIFYDDKYTTSDSSGMTLARSEDGGNTWKEFQINDENFKPQPIGGLGQGYQGDNISITSSNGKLWPVWMDNRTGTYQIWTVPIELSLVSIDEEINTVSEFGLEQNYPNPFNPNTTINYSLPSESIVSLKIFNSLGEEVLTLIDNEYQSTGSHSKLFAVNSTLPSGIYFYRLQAGSFVETKKMILMK